MDGPPTAPADVGPLINVTRATTNSGFTVSSTLFWPWQIIKSITTWTARAIWSVISLLIISPIKTIFSWVTAPLGFLIYIFEELEPLFYFLLLAALIGFITGGIIVVITELIMALINPIVPQQDDTSPKSAKAKGKQKDNLANTPGSASGSASDVSFDLDEDAWETTAAATKTQFLTRFTSSNVKKRSHQKPPLQGLLTETIHEESSSNIGSPSSASST